MNLTRSFDAMQSFQSVRKEPKVALRRIFSLISEEMELVETEFKNHATSNIQVISFLGEYLRASGGKRIRPSLLILASKAVRDGPATESVIRIATVMEMLHTATLVHDDIIDNADTRRSKPSVNARFGNQASVLMGDWLYMSAFEIALRERSLDILDILTALTRKMTEGELIQLTHLGRSDITEEIYFDILRRKTAYLFSSCCEIGAILAGAESKTRTAMREFGLNLGIAFQLADDVLDFTADDSVLGKASGADLIEGKLTLPLILLVADNPGEKAFLEQIMRDGVYHGDTRTVLLEKLKRTGTLEETRNRALGYAESAKRNIANLPKTEYRLALEDIPALMIDREK